ncbi:SlyX protein [Neisseria sp. HSC-16F19]|nr:SlyX family protein [Neisseria sp. HSC-16F19]MCP2039868.1 SlyX protein [Neisseria sp. HSC-16F19]
MSSDTDIQARLDELEIRVALQDELLDSLNHTVARLQQTLDLQQAQLRLIYQRLPESPLQESPSSAADNIPPHY